MMPHEGVHEHLGGQVYYFEKRFLTSSVCKYFTAPHISLPYAPHLANEKGWDMFTINLGGC